MNMAAEQQPYDEAGEAEKAREAERVKMVLAELVQKLSKDVKDRIAKRGDIEARWLKNTLQYEGKYDDETNKRLKKAKTSQLFINITRPKTNACEARISDMLFPTDDKNWGIKPTPVPELTGPKANPETAQQILAEADARAKAMETTIEDQLVECGYNIEARAAIRDACRLGTGILKGPIAGDKTARRWTSERVINPDGSVTEVYVLGDVTDNRPTIVRVDPWCFFPDPSAGTIEASESNFELHLMNAKELRGLAKKPGFDPEAIRRLLKNKPNSADIPPGIRNLRGLKEKGGGNAAAGIDGLYMVWEYRGPLTLSDMRDICACMGREEMLEGLDVDGEDDDPLIEFPAVLWFCDGEALKFGIHHLDSGEGIYSVFSLDKDDASILGGRGVPDLMEDSQRALNAAWRMMMDNSGLSTGPQIVIDPAVITPADDDNTLSPMKVWLRKAGTQGKDAFQIFNIDGHQAELANIIAMAQKFVDDETGMPVIAQGEQGAHVTKTAQGMALLMNSLNVIFRRMVKNFDDQVTVPTIRRIYDWNMQFSDKPEIKGDFQIDARGSSVLLVREVQSQNLMVMLLQFAANPVLAPLMKVAPAFRLLVKSMMLAANEVVKTDEEIQQELEKMKSEAGGQVDPEVIKANVKAGELTNALKIAQLDAGTRLEIARLNRDTAMMKAAAELNMSLDEIRAKFAKLDSDERRDAAEIATKQRMGSGI